MPPVRTFVPLALIAVTNSDRCAREILAAADRRSQCPKGSPSRPQCRLRPGGHLRCRLARTRRAGRASSRNGGSAELITPCHAAITTISKPLNVPVACRNRMFFSSAVQNDAFRLPSPRDARCPAPSLSIHYAVPGAAPRLETPATALTSPAAPLAAGVRCYTQVGQRPHPPWGLSIYSVACGPGTMYPWPPAECRIGH